MLSGKGNKTPSWDASEKNIKKKKKNTYINRKRE